MPDKYVDGLQHASHVIHAHQSVGKNTRMQLTSPDTTAVAISGALPTESMSRITPVGNLLCLQVLRKRCLVIYWQQLISILRQQLQQHKYSNYKTCINSEFSTSALHAICSADPQWQKYSHRNPISLHHTLSPPIISE